MAPNANHAVPVDLFLNRKVDHLIEDGPHDQSLQIVANTNIGSRRPGFIVQLHTNGMVGPGNDPIVQIRAELQVLAWARAAAPL